MSYFKKTGSSRSVKCILSGMLLGACCSLYAATDLIPQLMEQGLKKYSNKDYAAAADYLGQVVDMDPNQSQARYYLTYSLAMSGDNEKALKHAEVLVQKFPGDSQYQVLANQIRAEISRQATKKKQNAAASGKIEKEVMFGGYKSLDKNAEMRKPREDYTPRDIKPPRPLTDLEKAVRKIDEEKFDEAEKMLNDIIKKEPKNAEAYHNLGVIEFSRFHYKNAVAKFKKAIEINPNEFQSQFLLADCYRNMDDLVNAEKALRKAIEMKHDEFAMMNLAEICTKQGKMDEAEKIYSDLVKKSPNSGEAKLGLASIRLNQGMITEALEMVNSVISSGDYPEAHNIKAQLLLENKMYSEALEEVSKALASSPNNQKYLATRAICRIKSLDFTQGMDDANSILAANPDSVQARLVIAEGLIESGAEDDAENQLSEIDKTGEFAEAFRLRAIIATRKGNNALAKQHYNKYMELAGGRPSPAFEYAEFLERNDSKSEAVDIYHAITKQYAGSYYANLAEEALSRLGIQVAKPAESDNGNNSKRSKETPGKVKF